MEEKSSTLSLDERKDFAFYLYLTGSPDRTPYRQVILDRLIPCTGPWIIMDYTATGRVRGIEILGDGDERGETSNHSFDESGTANFHIIFTGHFNADSPVHRTVALHEIVPEHLGPRIHFDFDAADRIMGIRIAGEG